jgi:hypothetical protein
MRELGPPPPPADAPPSPAIGEPGVLEDLARHAGLEPVEAGDVDVPFEAPDRPTLVRALLAPGAMGPAIERSGIDAVARAVIAATERFRRPDGTYRLENRFRYVVALSAQSSARPR